MHTIMDNAQLREHVAVVAKTYLERFDVKLITETAVNPTKPNTVSVMLHRRFDVSGYDVQRLAQEEKCDRMDAIMGVVVSNVGNFFNSPAIQEINNKNEKEAEERNEKITELENEVMKLNAVVTQLSNVLKEKNETN